MTGRRCKHCGRPVQNQGPAYCSRSCLQSAGEGRRRAAVARSRARRAETSTAANTTIDTEGAWIVTRVWVGGQLQSEQREPVA
jgi:hypothetical protein